MRLGLSIAYCLSGPLEALAQHDSSQDTEAVPTPQTDVERRKQAASKRFLRGLEFARTEQSWDAALAEFLASRELFPTRVAVKNAAISLTHLRRYADALDMYAELLRDYGDVLSPEEKTSIEQSIAELVERVGELQVTSEPPGAEIAIDGRLRGSTPLAGLTVSAGTHSVRISKPGFESADVQVVVASKQQKTVSVSLKKVPTDRQKSAAPAVTQSTGPAAFSGKPYVALSGGLALAPSFRGGADEACGANVVTQEGANADACFERQRPLGGALAARAGYEFARGISAEVTLGYLRLAGEMKRRLWATGEGGPRYFSADYRDETELSAPYSAFSIAYRMLEKTPITARLSLGVARARVVNRNVGTYNLRVPNPDPRSSEDYLGTQRLSIPEHSATLWLPLVAAELRVGYRLSSRFTIDIGTEFMLLFAGTSPRTGATTLSREGERKTALADISGGFSDGKDVRPGVMALPKEDRLGTMLVIVPNVGIRLDL